MIIAPKHLHALDVVSVLLFSLLANYILMLKIDFRSALDFIALGKLVLLSVSSIVFYSIVVRLNQIERYSRAEYDAETSIEEQARRSVEDRYRDYYGAQSAKITIALVIAIACGITFFFVQPFVEVLG